VDALASSHPGLAVTRKRHIDVRPMPRRWWARGSRRHRRVSAGAAGRRDV